MLGTLGTFGARSRIAWLPRNAGWWMSVEGQEVDLVFGEPTVDTDEGEGFDVGLGYQHPVEGIGVTRWQAPGSHGVFGRNSEGRELVRRYGIEEVGGGLEPP